MRERERIDFLNIFNDIDCFFSVERAFRTLVARNGSGCESGSRGGRRGEGERGNTEALKVGSVNIYSKNNVA